MSTPATKYLNGMTHASVLSNFSKANRQFDDNVFSLTSAEQRRVEECVEDCVKALTQGASLQDPSSVLVLLREQHAAYLRKGLQSLGRGYESLDASRPWLCYWILHGLELLNEPIPSEVSDRIISFLKKCEAPTGGYGGGPDQNAHLATTYAAVMALCILGTKQAYDSINRKSLLAFIKAMKQRDGSFTVHADGERDIRGAYCALAVASLTNLTCLDDFSGTAEWVRGCQTYEGGFGAEPGSEAHGGYTFCGLASLLLLGRDALCDAETLLKWLTWKQMRFEGGFQGRTNKLVDGCYSFWQGVSFPLLHEVLAKRKEKTGIIIKQTDWLFDREALQNYILICCQHPDGGLLDKPGKNRDYYHTCYCLSGLSIAQHCCGEKPVVVGSPDNLLVVTHPVYNISLEAEHRAKEYFLLMDKP